MSDAQVAKHSPGSRLPDSKEFAERSAATPPPASPVHPIEKAAAEIDKDAVTAKYKEEREKRLRSDGVNQFRETEGDLAAFKEDIWAPPLVRDPISAEKKVLVVGGGFGGLVMGVNLVKQGVEDLLIVERGSDFGGTWYWNQYPGVPARRYHADFHRSLR